VTSASNALTTLAVFCVVILISLAAAGRAPGGPQIGLFVVYLLQYLLIVIGFSLATSVLFPRYRDLNQVWDVVSQAGFFIAPIVYPLSIIPERYHFFLYVWPPTPIVQFSRAVLVDGTMPTGRAHALLAAATLASLVIGILVFRRYGPQVAEHL
jgi:lipopolysaccharide transport system permease protein